jgi:hypothetical protein
MVGHELSRAIGRIADHITTYLFQSKTNQIVSKMLQTFGNEFGLLFI